MSATSGRRGGPHTNDEKGRPDVMDIDVRHIRATMGDPKNDEKGRPDVMDIDDLHIRAT